MNQKLRFIMLALLCAMLNVAWGDQVTISPTQALNNGGVSPITVTCAKGDGTSDPAISSGQLRLYQAASGKTTGNTITFSSENTISSIVFTFANNMTADNGVFSEGSYDSTNSTWTGSTKSVTLTVTGTKSGERIYITEMVVTYTNDQPASDKYYVAGTWTNWENGKIQMTKKSDGTYALANQTLSAEAQFKIIKEAADGGTATWYGGAADGETYWVTADNHTDISLTGGDGGKNFYMPIEGKWTFTVDPTGDTPTLTVDGWPEWEYYLMGDFNEWATSNSYKFSEAGGVYSLSKPIKLGEKFKIYAKRGSEEKWYGAVSNGDFYVNAEYVDTELSLTTPGENFLMNLSNKKPTWTIDFSPANNTLKLSNFISDIAKLPFEYDGGRSGIETTPGLTQTGLGTDYSSSPYLKFDHADDAVILHFDERPGTLTYEIKGNSFSGGTFQVLTSVNGEDWDILKEYSSIDKGQSEEFPNLGENVRYIKWLYKTKSSGNVALGNINLESSSLSPSITVEPSELTLSSAAASGDGDFTVTIKNFDLPQAAEVPVFFYDPESGNEIEQPNWIQALRRVTEVADGTYSNKIYYEVLENRESAPRSVKFNLTYFTNTVPSGMIESNMVTLTQMAYNGADKPYTVAEARAAIDANSGVTGVYVQGIVSKIVTEYNAEYGNITYDISDNGTTTANQLRAYRGKSYNGDNFTSANDIQVGDIVVVYGDLTKYDTIYELAQDNQLVSLERPDAPAAITVAPDQATVTADGGEGFFTITSNFDMVFDGDPIIYCDENGDLVSRPSWITSLGVDNPVTRVFYNVKPNSGEERKVYFKVMFTTATGEAVYSNLVSITQSATPKTYVKVTSTADITDGNYLIVYEGASVAFDGSLETLDAVSNTIDVEIENSKIKTDLNAYFTLDVTNGTIKSYSGHFIGMSSYENNLRQDNAATNKTNSFSIDDSGNAVIAISFEKGNVTLRYNSASNQTRFRYYKSGQQAIQLYKEEVPEVDALYTLEISDKATDGESYFATMGNIGTGNFVVPMGVSVSTVEVTENGKIERDKFFGPSVIPGAGAYLVESDAPGQYNFLPATAEDGEVEEIGVNMLHPFMKGETAAAPEGELDTDYTFYKLSLKQGGVKNSVGFYYGAAGGAPFESANDHSAYLAVPKSVYNPNPANEGILIQFDGDADGIQGVSTTEQGAKEVYTLTGTRVQGSLPKGVYIVNGRKQVVR